MYLDGSLENVDAKLQKFAMDPRSAPERVDEDKDGSILFRVDFLRTELTFLYRIRVPSQSALINCMD